MTQLQLAFPSLMGKTIFDEFFRNDAENLVSKSTTGFPVSDIYKDSEVDDINFFEAENNKVTIISEGTESTKGRRIARRAFRKSFVNYDNLLDLSNTSASFEHGLLRLKIPTKAEATKRIITIE